LKNDVFTFSEIGAHILSGNVLDPRAMNELFPELSTTKDAVANNANNKNDDDVDQEGDNDDDNDELSTWVTKFQEEQGSYATPVKKDELLWLQSDLKTSYKVPNMLLPPELHNDGNYIVSLSQLCRWLATQAENLGVEIYPGFAADSVLFGNDNSDNDSNNNTGNNIYVKGIITKDVGINKDGELKSTYERGMELHARQTIFAEGARGSCTESLIQHYNLRDKEEDCFQQTYGLGIKEVWQISNPEENPLFQPGYVQHTIGFPLQSSLLDKTYGGSFLYHQEPDLILLGVVIGLDYENPYINPYQEFQRWKTHDDVKKFIQDDDAVCVSYGARVLNEGGYHSIPKLTFPGGMLVGCSAGFLNVVKIKGTHTAMKSGMIAAENIYDQLTNDSTVESVAETGELPQNKSLGQEIESYETDVSNSWIHDELYSIRNVHESFNKFGLGGGMVYTGLSTFITRGKEPWTFKPHKERDTDKTKTKSNFDPINYPLPDNKITFDLLTNLQRSNTYHDEDQPSHLQIKPELQHIPKLNVSLELYDGPEQKFCPAGVYEYIENDSKVKEINPAIENSCASTNEKEMNQPKKKLVINAQNCIHCKCCSIKMPDEYITWTVPEGGGGPQYQNM